MLTASVVALKFDLFVDKQRNVNLFMCGDKMIGYERRSEVFFGIHFDDN